MDLNRRQLYRLPWSAVDNVNGWIEPTSRCNLRCRACYRRDQGQTLPFEEVRGLVDRTIELRNCDLLSIAGGEPLLVDYLEDLIRYIRSRGVHVMVLTNGMGLDDSRLASLAAAGLDRLNIHVDSGQGRPGWEDRNEAELLALRDELLERVTAHGIECGFITTLYEASHRHLPAMLSWAVSRAGRLASLTFDLFRYYPDPRDVERCLTPTGESVDPAEVGRLAVISHERRYTAREVWKQVDEALGGIAPHSYLNGTHKQDEVKWLLATVVVQRGEILGWIGPRAAELATVGSHLLRGRYPSFVGGSPSRLVFAGGLVDRPLRQALGRYLWRAMKAPSRLLQGVDLLSLAVIQPTDWYTDGLQNMCDSCPDAIIHGDVLVPSCRLDEYRQYGGPVQAVFRPEIPRHHESLQPPAPQDG